MSLEDIYNLGGMRVVTAPWGDPNVAYFINDKALVPKIAIEPFRPSIPSYYTVYSSYGFIPSKLFVLDSDVLVLPPPKKAKAWSRKKRKPRRLRKHRKLMAHNTNYEN